MDMRERGRGPEGVNRPDLLPSGPTTNVIDLERLMAKGQVTKMDAKLTKLQQDSGAEIVENEEVIAGLEIELEKLKKQFDSTTSGNVFRH